jgi:DNA-directed RNA polymerase specialized sigma24 family protein
VADSPLNRTDVVAAIGGDAGCMRRVLEAIVPVIRVRVARALYKYRSRVQSRSLVQEAEDLSQEILVTLLADGGRVLSSWDPARGLPLRDFVGLVAERGAIAILRSGSRTPWREDLVEAGALDLRAEKAPSIEGRVVSRDFAERLYFALREDLSPLGFDMFCRLFVEEQEVEAICRETTLSRDAVYTWKNRLAKRIRELASRLEEVPLDADDVNGAPGRQARVS